MARGILTQHYEQLLGLVPPWRIREVELDHEAQEVRVRVELRSGARLRCPVCQGLSVQDSPSELALELRDVVRDQLRAGKSPAEVKAYFVERYGEWILLRPKPSGFNRLLYLLPFVAVLAGAVTITLAVRKWTRTGSNPDIAAGDGT